MKDKKTFFFCSYPRSGSTWLRFIVEHYITGKIPFNEEGLVVRGDNAMEFYDNVSPWKNLTSKDVRKFSLLRPTALAWMCSHWQVGEETVTRDVILKSHNGNYPLGGVPQFPEEISSGVLVLVRDPRDVAVSISKYLGMTIQEACEYICNPEACLEGDDKPPTPIGDWNSWVYSFGAEMPFPVTCIRYEDMVRDTSEIVSKVLEVIGEEVDKDKLGKSIEYCNMRNMQKRERESEFISHSGKGKFFRKGKIGGWQDVLSQDQCKLIESNCADMMKVFGYNI